MKELITYNKPKSPISEAYRGIRTNIQYANVDKKIKTILVTSSTAGEGKTTTLLNLAVVLASSNRKILVVDCDMRKPRVHKALEVTNKKGLAELLLNGDHHDNYIQEVNDIHLDVLTAGKIPGNPSELLFSDAMRTLVEKLKEEYDFILFDTPPVLPVTDAIIMSDYTDGVVLVINSGKVNIDVARKAKDSFEAVNANILGVVLNRVPVDNRKTYESYYYYQSKNKEE